MLQGWSMEERIDAHRRDLLAEAQVHQSRARVLAEATAAPSGRVASQLSATGLPVAGGRTVRRTGGMSQKLGSWLIDAGTRLGGATIRTS